MPFSSSRRRSRGIALKESSGIWKVENEGIDSMRERYRIKGHRLLNGKTRRSRLVSNESSDESMGEEMDEERSNRTVINKPKLKVCDEVIGVPVPRRARTAISGAKRRPSDSVAAPQRSNPSKGSREEMASISESEVEVAKFLFGLTRLHSQHSGAMADPSHASSLHDIAASPKDSKRKKSRHLESVDTEKTCKSEGTSNAVNASSPDPASSTDGHQVECSLFTERVAPSLPKDDKISPQNNSGHSNIEAQLLGPQDPVPVPIIAEENPRLVEKPSPSSPINSKLFMSPGHHEKANSRPSKKEDGSSDVNFRTQHEQSEQLIEEESNQMKQGLPSLPSQNETLNVLKSSSNPSLNDGVKKVKYEIDLMALPDDGEVDATNECNNRMSNLNQGAERGCKKDSFELATADSKLMQNCGILYESPVEGVAKGGMKKPLHVEGKTELHQDINYANKMAANQNSERMMKNPALLSAKSGLSNNITTMMPLQIPMSIPCWPSGLRPFGLPSTGASPAEGNTLRPHAPLLVLPQRQPGHCATHCFIARLIHYQQQLAKFNPLCQAVTGSTSKPYSLSMLPQPRALFLCGAVMGNPNAPINGSFVSGSVVPLNGQYGASCSGPVHDTEKGKQLLLQQHQGGLVLFPINQMQNETAGQKTSNLSENESLLRASSASSALTLAGTSYSNLAAIPDPRYLAMFKGSYQLGNAPGYQSSIAQQQHSSASRSQSWPLQLVANHSSSETFLQARQFLQSSKTSSEANINKSELPRSGEIPPSQRTLQNYSLPTERCEPFSPILNEAKTLLKAQSSGSGLSDLNHLRKQVAVQANSPISTLSTSVSTASSLAYVDRNNLQEALSSQKESKPEASVESSSNKKLTPMPYSTATAKLQQTFFSNSMPGHQNNLLRSTFPGSLNLRKPTFSTSNGLTAVSYVQEAASVPVISAARKPAA